MRELLHRLFALPALPCAIADVADFWKRHREVTGDREIPVHRAVLGGFAADRPAYAFTSGYQEALRSLFGRVVPQIGDAKVALCATETGGNHPAAIQTQLVPEGEGYRLSGEKTWASFGHLAEQYIVFASEGKGGTGHNRIAAVWLPADREGVARQERNPAELPLMPEVPHARVRFDNVRVAAGERLPGDGYSEYLKPFRTVEDCHVHAALLGWILQVARRCEWPETAQEELAALIVGMCGLAVSDPSDAAVHVALAGVIAQLARFLGDCEAQGLWARVDSETQARWQRDRAVLRVAGSARARRREVAWERLRGTKAAAME